MLIDLGYPYNAVAGNIILVFIGLGVGGLFLPPLIALQAAMPTRDMAVATGAMVLLRLLGGTVGIAVGGTVLSNQLESKLAQFPQFTLVNLGASLQTLQKLEPFIRDLVLTAYAEYTY